MKAIIILLIIIALFYYFPVLMWSLLGICVVLLIIGLIAEHKEKTNKNSAASTQTQNPVVQSTPPAEEKIKEEIPDTQILISEELETEKQSENSISYDDLKEVQTRKKDFLEQISRILPWDELSSIAQPCYNEIKFEDQRYELNLLLRIYLLQDIYKLTDDGIRNEIADSRAFSDFCGVESSDQIPDGNAIEQFRNLMIDQERNEKFFALVNKTFAEQKLILKKGAIVDSSVISTSTFSKNIIK